MELYIQQANLKDALRAVRPAVPTRSRLRILDNVLIQANGDGLVQFTATNLDLTIRVQVAAQIDRPGEIAVPAAALNDLAQVLPDGAIRMMVAANGDGEPQMAVVCGSTKSTFKGAAIDEFPKIAGPPDGAEPLRVPGEVFAEMVRRVTFAAAHRDENRPVLQGVLVQLDGDHFAMAATDSYRLAVELHDRDAEHPPVAAIVPAPALDVMARFAGEGDVAIYVGEDRVILRAGDVEVNALQLDGNYPDYAQTIPKTWSTRAIVARDALLEACSQVHVFARESAFTARLEIEAARIKMRARSQQTGDAQVLVEAEVDGSAPVSVAYNSQFLADALDVIQTEKVALEITGEDRPGVLRPVGGSEYVYVIMPLRLG